MGVDLVYLKDIAKRYPNVAVCHIPNPLRFDDEQFYQMLANEQFVNWIAAYNKAKGVQ
jgi:hypothetical protein